MKSYEYPNTSGKRGKRPSSFEIRLHLNAILNPWASNRIARITTRRAMYYAGTKQILYVRTFSYALCARKTWAQVFTPAYGRE
jgi:hypothetical protein